MKKLWTLSLLLLVGAVVFVGCGETTVDNPVDEIQNDVEDENTLNEEPVENVTDEEGTTDENETETEDVLTNAIVEE